MRRRRLPGIAAALAGAAIAPAFLGPQLLQQLPPRWNPAAPLTIDEAPGPFTRWKLRRASADPEACRRLLGSAPIVWEPVPDRDAAAGCGYSNAGRISRTSAAIGTPFVLSCPAALSLVLWERHVLQPAARSHFGERVVRIEHYGSYACRNVYHRRAGPRSRHASAAALDVAGFVLADGRRIRLRGDWAPAGDVPPDPRRPSVPDGPGAFLREVREGACRWFDGVYSPDYNAAHADHFHFDRGPYRSCR